VKHTLRFVAASFALSLFLVVAAFAQGDTLSGKYEGTARVTGSPDAPITLELKIENGKISGHFTSGQTSIEISEGTLTEGKLSLKLGAAAKDGVLTAKVDGDKLTGEWIAGSQKKTVELKKAVAATAAAAPVNLNGQWDAVADAQGQPVPFLLTLKVDGEKVTGSSSSQLGDSNITTGTWKDGKLSFQLEGTSGVISMAATVVDGKLTGEFDFAGQLQGKWIAVKKN
jgi:hypothetical protein